MLNDDRQYYNGRRPPFVQSGKKCKSVASIAAELVGNNGVETTSVIDIHKKQWNKKDVFWVGRINGEQKILVRRSGGPRGFHFRVWRGNQLGTDYGHVAAHPLRKPDSDGPSVVTTSPDPANVVSGLPRKDTVGRFALPVQDGTQAPQHEPQDSDSDGGSHLHRPRRYPKRSCPRLDYSFLEHGETDMSESSMTTDSSQEAARGRDKRPRVSSSPPQQAAHPSGIPGRQHGVPSTNAVVESAVHGLAPTPGQGFSAATVQGIEPQQSKESGGGDRAATTNIGGTSVTVEVGAGGNRVATTDTGGTPVTVEAGAGVNRVATTNTSVAIEAEAGGVGVGNNLHL